MGGRDRLVPPNYFKTPNRNEKGFSSLSVVYPKIGNYRLTFMRVNVF